MELLAYLFIILLPLLTLFSFIGYIEGWPPFVVLYERINASIENLKDIGRWLLANLNYIYVLTVYVVWMIPVALMLVLISIIYAICSLGVRLHYIGQQGRWNPFDGYWENITKRASQFIDPIVPEGWL